MNGTKVLSVLSAATVLNIALVATPALAQRRACVETDRGQRVCGRLIDDGYNNNNNNNSNNRCDVSGFDEKFYLEAYPDVEAAIRQGRVRNACDHYKQNGRYEGRFPRFNEASYLANNPDVAQAVRNRQYKSGYDHWYKVGRYENRKL